MKKYELKFHILVANFSYFRYSWRKIKLRVSMIMKQIFLETKKHNLLYVYKLQNYLINSTEFQIFVFNRVNAKISSLYYISKRQSLNKIKEFFSKKKSLKRVLQIIKQDILFNCISPTFNAKIINHDIKDLELNFSNKKEKYFNYLTNKYMNKKLICSKYIKRNIIFILDRSEYLNRYHYYNKKLNNNMSEYLYNKLNLYKHYLLETIVNNIVLNDFRWYSFYKYKKGFYKKSEKKSMYFKQEFILFKSIYNHVNYYMKYILRRKLFIKLNSRILLDQIIHVYTNFFSFNNKVVSRKIIQLTNVLMNQKLHYLIKHNIYLINRYLKYKVNSILNKNIYIYSLETFYLKSYYSM